MDVYDTSIRLMTIFLLMTPHCVVWGYVVWKAVLYFFGRSCKDSNKERRKIPETERKSYDAMYQGHCFIDRRCNQNYKLVFIPRMFLFSDIIK